MVEKTLTDQIEQSKIKLTKSEENLEQKNT